MLRENWFELIVAEGVDQSLPGIYEWVIEGRGSYIGKYTHCKRPLREYTKNVSRLLSGLPYRPAKPDGFRRVHRELGEAVRNGRKITLILVENCEPSQLSSREAELIRERGLINGPTKVRSALMREAD